jgi:phage terminase Nu1 subunit (DNA packaging protein)
MAKRKEKSESPRIVGIKQVAVILNLTVARIQQLVQEGLPKKLRGKYDQDECTGWYIRYLQALVEKKAIVDEGGQVFKSEREERLRLLRADADLRELDLARKRGQLVSIEDVEHEMTDLILVTKARILAVGARVAPELVGETSRVMIQAVIEKAHKEALSHLAKKELGA